MEEARNAFDEMKTTGTDFRLAATKARIAMVIANLRLGGSYKEGKSIKVSWRLFCSKFFRLPFT